MSDGFVPAWWCRNAHLQTIWPVVARPLIRPLYRRERLELADGDFIDLDWFDGHGDRGIAVLLHGLEGSSRSHYIRSLACRLAAHGWDPLVMHFRGCSGTPNRLARGYHSGDTADLDHVIRMLRQRHPESRLVAAGFSLGGNVLLKWSGEQGAACPLSAVVAVSVPFDLAVAARTLECGASRLYERWLLSHLRHSAQIKISHGLIDLDAQRLRHLDSFHAFDDYVTAPLHGFSGADDYYRRASCRSWLRRIRVQTLIVQARDDPFLAPDGLPTADQLSPAITFELSAHGGHVGFVSGRTPLRPHYWLDRRIPAFFQGITPDA